MSEKEREIIEKLSSTVPKLDKDKQSYILGVAEGMAMARQTKKRKSSCRKHKQDAARYL